MINAPSVPTIAALIVNLIVVIWCVKNIVLPWLKGER